MTAVTAADVRERMLEPTMDLRALNQWLGGAINDLLDYVAGVHHLLPDEVRRSLTAFALLAREINDNAGEVQCEVSGFAESYAATLFSTTGRVSLNRQHLAGRLRTILRPLDATEDPIAYVRADRQLAELRRHVPDATLLSPSLARNLGPGKSAKLAELVQLDGAGA